VSIGSSALPRAGRVFPDGQIRLHIGVLINLEVFHAFGVLFPNLEGDREGEGRVTYTLQVEIRGRSVPNVRAL